MKTQVLVILLAAVCTYQGLSEAATETYVSEVMVESNVTLDASSILSSWQPSEQLTVTVGGTSYTVTISSSILVAECLVVGEDYNCNCSSGLVWSNEVCYNLGCCSESPCLQNVSLVSSICVSPTHVVINGTVQNPVAWSAEPTFSTFESLNGFKNVTTTSWSSNLAHFEVNVNVWVNTSKLQEILDQIKPSSGSVFADTTGMVDINGSRDIANYESSRAFNCVFAEDVESSGWNLSRTHERFEVLPGLLTQIDQRCASPDKASCLNLKLNKLTSIWAGTYECGFIIGSVRHTAKIFLDVALLPDKITMTTEPLIADCLNPASPPEVTVTAVIPVTNANFTVTWSPPDANNNPDSLVIPKTSFSNTFKLTCSKDPQTVTITFTNRINQKKSNSVTIPVLKAGTSKPCEEEDLDGLKWPKTPPDTTVSNPKCPEGRVGFRNRTCTSKSEWEAPISQCVSEELGKVANAAEQFLNGLGASQEVALDIFAGIKNSSSTGEASADQIADIGASISIIGVMASASERTVLEEGVLPDFVEAASNMVNSNWSGAPVQMIQDMSSNYLESVEGLVRNIKINQSSGLNTSNLELRFCSTLDCDSSVFGVPVTLDRTNGTVKTMGIRNIMEKLKNDKFDSSGRSSILLSATLVDNYDANISIEMVFPNEDLSFDKYHCVFWDTQLKDWSTDGCTANVTEDNQTVCVCNHLTSFSVLMAKDGRNVSSESLDMITYIGLGVSIFSLLLFLFIESLVWHAVTKSNLSHFRHTAVVNIAIFRMLADCSFLASAFPDRISENMCFWMTVCKHLFYLAMFTWMLCLSVMLVHQLIFVFSPVRKRVFMFLSAIVGYIVPIVLVGTSYVYYKYKEKDYFDRKICWLTYVRLLEGSIHAFLLPVGTIILSNLFSMVVVIVTLVKTSVPDSSKADEKDTAKSILKVVVLLTPLFGVTWIVGFLLYTLESTSTFYQPVNYIFTILNSFQGLFILLTGCLAEQKVRDELVRIIMVKTGKETDSMKKLTTTTTTTYSK